MIRIVLLSFIACAFPTYLKSAVINPSVLVYSGSPQPQFRPEPQQSLLNQVPILRYTNENEENGNYRFAYETGNGISVQETAKFSPSVPEGGAVVTGGSFSFTGADGHPYSISYTADENGFRPVGAHIPTPPPIPEAIAKSLVENARSSLDGNSGQYQPLAIARAFRK